MRCCALIVSSLILLLPAACAESNPVKVNVEAGGLRLVAPFKSADEALNPFGGRTSGTTVSLLISTPAGNFVRLDTAESAITRFTDDKGNDLLAKKEGPPPAQGDVIAPQGFSLFPLISKDGKACAVEVNSQVLPIKGSSAVLLSGVVSMLCATSRRECVQKDVPVKNGSKLAADDINLSFERVGVPDVGVEPLSLTLRSHQELDRIAEVKFFKPDGTEIKSRSMGGLTKMAVLGELTVEWTFNLAEKADAVTVAIYVWSDIQKVKQPFELTIGAGL